MSNEFQFESAGISDLGLVRTENEDQFLVAELTRCMQSVSSSLPLQAGSQLTGGVLGQLLIVADGMGGHRAGADASRVAVEYFVASILNRLGWLFPKVDADETALIEDLKLVMRQSDREIERLSQEKPELKGMGTTFTMAYVVWPRMYIVHAGDSRCYLLRRGELQVLTRDHTLYQRPNILTNALGAGSQGVHVEIRTVQLEEGDSVLLCSDGLNKHVDDKLIQQTMLENTDPRTVCRSLIDHANKGGGSDNTTLVVGRWGKSSEDEGMPIFESLPSDRTLFREIAFPPEETETADIETLHLSAFDLREFSVESAETASNEGEGTPKDEKNPAKGEQ
jgi:serine/threonine protein phosphatase PrpC